MRSSSAPQPTERSRDLREHVSALRVHRLTRATRDA